MYLLWAKKPFALALITLSLGACESDDQSTERNRAPSSFAPAVGGQNNPPQTVGTNTSTSITGVDNTYPAVVGNYGTKTKIRFLGSQNDQVPGYIWIPNQLNGRAPAVLLMYGLNGNKDDGGVREAAEKLNQNGIIAMTLDWPGTGERGMIATAQRILGQGFDQTVNDYRAAINYLGTRPEVDSQKLGYVGASWGAITGAAFVSQEPRIRAAVALVPVPNPLLGANSPDQRLKQIAPRPLLCIYSQNGGDLSDTVCNAARSSTTTITGLATDHEMSGVREQVYELSKNFLVQHLR